MRPGTRLFLALALSYAYFIHRGEQWNAESRLDLVYAIVDQHTLSIDAYHANTQDKAFFRGHYYSDKAPGMAFAAVPAYLLLELALGRDFLQGLDFLTRYLLALLVVGLPSALCGVLLWRLLARWDADPGRRWWLAVGYGLGTMAFPFATLFYGQQFAANLLLAAFVLIVTADLARGRALLAGLLCGYAVISEYPAAIVAAGLGLYALHARGWRGAAWMAAGAVPALALAAAYNLAVFGSPLATGYAHLAGDPQFVAGQSRGLLGITLPRPEALWQTSFGPYRGLFLLSPFLLLSLYGLRELALTGRWALCLLTGGVSALYFLVNASYFAWDGGYSLGPRLLVPVLPLFTLPAIFGLRRWPLASRALVVVSVLVVSAGTTDIPVAEEALVTAETMGNRVQALFDVGVAGIHRLLGESRHLRQARVLIVAAGMEGALPSVVGGLVAVPVIAVPTSVGYGASFRGLAALLGMLNSCAPNVAVVNIDNGFGAGYLASVINRL